MGEFSWPDLEQRCKINATRKNKYDGEFQPLDIVRGMLERYDKNS